MKSENDPNEDPNKKPIFQSAKLQDLNIAESILEGWEAWPPLVRNLTRRRRLRCSHPCHRHHRHHHRHHRHHHHHHYVDRLQAGRDSEEAEAQSPGALGQEGWNSHPRWSKSSWSQSVWLMVICRTMMTRRVISYSLDTSMRLLSPISRLSFFRTNEKISVKKCANRKSNIFFRTSQASEAAFPNLCEDTCAAVPNASLKFRRGKIELCLVPPAYIQFTKKPKCTEAVEKSKPSGMERNLAVVIVWEESDIQTRGGHAARRRFYKCKCHVDIGTRILCWHLIEV